MTSIDAPPEAPAPAPRPPVDRRSALVGAAVVALLVVAFVAGRWSAPDAGVERIEVPRPFAVDPPEVRPGPDGFGVRPLLGLPRDAALFGLSGLPDGYEVAEATAERGRGDVGEQTVVLADGDDEVTITAVLGDGEGDGLDGDPSFDDGRVRWAPSDDLRIEVAGDGGEQALLGVAEVVVPLAGS